MSYCSYVARQSSMGADSSAHSTSTVCSKLHLVSTNYGMVGYRCAYVPGMEEKSFVWLSGCNSPLASLLARLTIY